MDVTDWSTQQSQDKLLHNLPKVNVINNAILHNRHCEPSIKYDHYNIVAYTIDLALSPSTVCQMLNL